MSTIDSLQIEIQTSSSNAGAGIEALAASLERLKKVGSFNVVIKNLNNLSSALDKLQGSSSGLAKLNSLASSIESLKKAGSFGSISNSFAKLGTALKDLESMNIDGVVAKIEELNKRIGPVSQNLLSLGNAFKTVNRQTKQTGDGFSSFGGKLNTTTLNLQSAISVVQKVWQVLKKVVDVLKKTIGEALEWDGIAQRFGRGFGDQAEEVYSWVQRLNQEMGINTQQFMQYSSTYATMLTGFGVASKDASKMALGYMELTYDIWAGYNDIYKSLDDAATAVRSAIAGEVEPVRKAGFTIIESTLEQTAANHGLKVSLENATEAQKSYLRYLTLVDQAKAQGLVGNYAREMNTAEGAVRTFTQQLKSLAQTFGSIFLPVLVKVMPWLQAFIDLVGDAIMAVAAFFNVDIQKVDFSSNLGDSADSATSAVEGTTKAMKELKNATTGIDELNIISPQSASGGSGSGSGSGGGFDGLDVGSLWDESIFDSIQFEVDAIKEQLKEALATIRTVLDGAAFVIGAVLVFSGANIPLGLGMMAAAAVDLTVVVAANWNSMSDQLAKTLVVIEGIVGGALLTLGALLAFSGVKVGLGIALMALGAVSIVSAAVVNWKFLEGDLKSTLTLLTAIVSGALLVLGALLAFTGFKVGLGIALMAAGVAGIVTAAALDWDFLVDSIKNVLKKIGIAVGAALLALGILLVCTGVALPIGIALIAVGATSLVAGVALNWDSIVNSIKKVLKKIGIVAGAAMLALGVILCLTGVGIPLGVGLIAAGAASLVSGVALNWGSIKKSVKNVINTIKDWAKKYGLLTLGIILCLTGAGIPLGIALIKKGLGTKTENGSTVGNDLLKTIKEKWNAIKKWWNSKPALKKVSAKIEDIKAKVSSAWTTAKNWWNEKKAAMKDYTPNIGSIKDKLSSAWETAKKWWNDNVKLSIPSLSFKVTYTTTGLNIVQNAIVKALGLSGWPKLSFAANGGIFDTGSLVWAGEAGPEIVASAGGGKTGVMNVQQMSEAVYEGVYSAVVAAMRASGGNGGSQAVNVYLDGKQITASVEQRQKERGAALMGNQVYAY